MIAAVITCSNRSAAGLRADDSGQLLADAVQGWGFQVRTRLIVPDEVPAIRSAIQDAIAGGARLVLTTGGTGLSPTDVTPEAVQPLIDRQIPGISERIRAVNVERVPTSVLSRGVSGMIGTSLVVTLPGSPGGVRDALAVLQPLVGHVLDQVTGGDHRPGGGV
ncbi:MAG: MogA/MoaB family molybdenum cofactor biosynthesis protein [Jatrophihabitantaceae bacterium]